MHQKKYTRRKGKGKGKRKGKGGKAIGSGGFGCIFRPALQCASSPQESRKLSNNGVSKLSIKLDVEKEMQQLELLKKYIKQIPNYQKYFLLSDITSCNPAPLTPKDKIGFEKCYALEDYNITEQTVNDNLHQLMIINMPYGGVTLTNIIEQSKLNFRKVNWILQFLLLYAIMPMNKLNVYHFDLKADNVLYNNDLLKIIDFGEIGVSTRKEPIPSILFNRRIQFNSPFSRILFADSVNLFINTYLRVQKLSKPSPRLYASLKEIVAIAYKDYKKHYGQGHEIYLGKYILPDLLGLVGNLEDPEQLLSQLIVDYCTRAVFNFIDFKTKEFDKVSYFNDVYSKNVDVYGWIMCYVPFIVRSLVDSSYNNSPKETKIGIGNIIVKFCFSNEYAAKPMPIRELLSSFKQVSA